MEFEELSSQDVHKGWRDVDDDSKPKVGLVFASLEEGYEFYKKYAKLAGFSVRKSATMMDTVTKERYSQSFVCSKQAMEHDSMFDVTYVNWAASVLYGYAVIVPAAFYFLLRYFGSNASLIHLWCMWGYSLFVFVPSSDIDKEITELKLSVNQVGTELLKQFI